MVIEYLSFAGRDARLAECHADDELYQIWSVLNAHGGFLGMRFLDTGKVSIFIGHSEKVKSYRQEIVVNDHLVTYEMLTLLRDFKVRDFLHWLNEEKSSSGEVALQNVSIPPEDAQWMN